MGTVSWITDRLLNVMSGMGTSVDKRMWSHYALDPVTAHQAESAYRSSWLVRKIVDIPPLDMTRAWRDWQTDGTNIEALEAEERRLGLKDKCKRALILSRLYGGGAILLGTADADPEQPLRPDATRKGGLKYLHVLSRHQLNVGQMRLDPADPWFGAPEYFELTTNATTSEIVRIHPSRVVAFIGQHTPEGSQLGCGSHYWGDPIMQSIGQAVKNADLAQDGFAALIEEAKIDILKIPNLTNHAATEKYEDRLLKRLQAATVGKSTWRSLMIDSEEDWQQKQISWGGMPDMLNVYLSLVAGAADIPVTRLLGQSPKGLASTGEGEERDYHSMVLARQDETLRPALDSIDQLLVRSALGSYPSDVYFEFAPLARESEKEGAAIEFQASQTLKNYSDMALFPDAVLAEIGRNRLVESGRWPGSEKAFEEAEAEQLAVGSEVELPQIETQPPPVPALDYNPNHYPARGPKAGQFAPKNAGGGVAAAVEGEVIALTEEVEADLTKANAFKDIEQIVDEATVNQKRLLKVGSQVAKESGAEFKRPPRTFNGKVVNGPGGIKSTQSILRKFKDELKPFGKSLGSLKDVSRATFVVETQEQTDAVIKGLSKEFKVYDRGWREDKESGYLDRKIYIQHENKGLSEIQVIPTRMYKAKAERGTELYNISRNPNLPQAERNAALAEQRKLYADALAGSPFEGLGK